MARVSYDFTDVEQFFADGKKEIRRRVADIGEDAVAYAVEHGNYHDVTGRLRASNKFNVSDDASLTITNTAPYASTVEARGKEVISGAALYAEERLKAECEEQ